MSYQSKRQSDISLYILNEWLKIAALHDKQLNCCLWWSGQLAWRNMRSSRLIRAGEDLQWQHISTSNPSDNTPHYHCHSLNVQTCMQESTDKHAHTKMHMHTLSELFFIKNDYVGQPPSLWTTVTLTHSDRGEESFTNRAGWVFTIILRVPKEKKKKHSNTYFSWAKLWMLCTLHMYGHSFKSWLPFKDVCVRSVHFL